MKKVIPFKKDIIFNTNLSEITSISLEHNIHASNNNMISGEFIINGEYKIIDSSTNVEPFSYTLPFEIEMDDKYILDNITVDIDDFYYEIINNKALSVNIEVLVDKLEEKPLVTSQNIVIEKEPEIEEIPIQNITIDPLNTFEGEEKMISQNNNLEKIELENTRSLFDDFDVSRETYVSYKICIVKEGDTVESILEKYSITKEELEKYNDLKELKLGDKLIIPSILNAKI